MLCRFVITYLQAQTRVQGICSARTYFTGHAVVTDNNRAINRGSHQRKFYIRAFISSELILWKKTILKKSVETRSHLT